jgi:hypothetical protein
MPTIESTRKDTDRDLTVSDICFVVRDFLERRRIYESYKAKTPPFRAGI